MTLNISIDSLKSIEPKNKHLVSGYIREIQLLLSQGIYIYNNIPSGIIDICILFFGNKHEWDPTTKSINLVITKYNILSAKTN